MHRTTDERWILSATDLVNFLGCPHLAALSRAGALGLVPGPPKYDDPALDALRARGLEHEQAYRDRLVAEGRRVVEIAEPSPELTYRERCALGRAATLAAMRAGADVIYQAWLVDDPWAGRADFLVRVDASSDLGDWSYEVADTKLAREAKGGALLQIMLYSDLLERMQGSAPAEAHLALGGPTAHDEVFRIKDYAAYYRSVRDRYLAWHAGAVAGALVHAPDPVEHCALCDWQKRCERERRDVDHLSFVAGITRRQRGGLVGAGLETLAGLAVHPREVAIYGLRDGPLWRVREQARVQLEGRRELKNVHELLLPIEDGMGLAALPAPSDGDLFLDFEGDPYALKHGLEYLVGWSDVNGEYVGRWALDRAGEKAAFEEFVDLVTARRQVWPDMHVYHYAAYERTALGKLMGIHATREEEVDDIFRGGVLVDLYRVVRQSLRASVESYSIKRMEPFYGFERTVDLLDATRALVAFSAWLQASIGERAPEMEATIEAYNRDDVLSTAKLRTWLETLRLEAIDEGAAIPRPEKPAEVEGIEPRDDEVAALADRLTSWLPTDGTEPSAEDEARFLMAHLLEFHRREDKPAWWEYFHWVKDLNDDDYVADHTTLGRLGYVGEVGGDDKSIIHRYRFPPQDHGLKKGTNVVNPYLEREYLRPEMAGVKRPSNLGPGAILCVDEAACTIDLERRRGSEAQHPTALVPKDIFYNKSMRTSLFGIGQAVVEHGLGDQNPFASATDLLMRRAPRAGQSAGASLSLPGESAVASAVRLTSAMERGVLPIQGPPGAGKTFTASHLIVQALKRGERVGVTATGHSVITQLVDRSMECATKAGVPVVAVQKISEDGQGSDREDVACIVDNKKLESAIKAGATLIGGTAWLWSRPEMVGSVDLLVIDEAGQFSLANALAVAPAAKKLVLVGDPQQLEQPIKGTHPPGVGVSSLSHILGEEHTVPEHQGLFLDHTWRLHPDLCRFTSELFYDDRLEPRSGLERQSVSGPSFSGTGLRLVTVEHVGNTTESPEEAIAIAEIVNLLLASHSWVDRDGDEKRFGVKDILVVAPYNLQVGAIQVRVPRGVEVGTVDKFQGREAPVVIYSTASSSAEDSPRGMDFLYSPNRLNVATSRAMCLAIVVAAPAIFAPECRTPAQMKLANAFCRFAELAIPLSPNVPGRSVLSDT